MSFIDQTKSLLNSATSLNSRESTISSKSNILHPVPIKTLSRK